MVSTVLRVLEALVAILYHLSIQSQCLTFPIFVLAFRGKVF